MRELPCGDFNWMRHSDLPGIDYTGIDIVQPLIERNQAMYTQPGRRFLRLDMLCDTLPRTDLILCRDGFVHLSFGDITRALRAMHDSGPEYLLVTTFIAHPRNREISTGGWRPLNLAIGPFYFPPPIVYARRLPTEWQLSRHGAGPVPLFRIVGAAAGAGTDFQIREATARSTTANAGPPATIETMRRINRGKTGPA